MKTLKPHPHVIKLLGCITESGKLSKIYWLVFHFTGLYLHYGIKSGSTVSVFDKFLLLNSAMVLVFLSPTQINTDVFFACFKSHNFWNMDSPGHSIWAVHYFSLRKKHLYFILLRTHVGIDRVCPIWRSPRLPEKEPWTQWHLQRSRHQTTNKSDATAADEICLANSWWNELLVNEICKLDSLIIAMV